MYIKSYKELIVWQKSVNLVEEIYFLTNQFPKEEIYGLSSQMRRAAVSIPSNIAEGQRRKDLPEFLQFLRIADASSAELETQVIISKRLYPKLNYTKVDGLLEEIQKMLSVMISKLGLKANSSKLKAIGGIAALPLVLMIGGLITQIIIAMLVSNFLLNQSESGLRLSSRAFLMAQSGYQDAFMRIIRDKEFYGSYTLVFPDGSADVTVCSDAPAPGCVGLDKDRITVVGKSSNRNRKFEAILDVSQTTGEATLESFTEVAL